MKRFATLVCLIALARGLSACTVLAEGQSSRAVCFTVILKVGETAHLSIPQTRDVAVVVRREAKREVVDSFEFGDETVTLAAPDEYNISVQSKPVLSIFSMSRTSLPLQAAEAWKEAEDLGTVAKASGKRTDINAALEARRNVGEPVAIARTLLARGDAEINASEMTAARASYEEALDLCRVRNNYRCSAEAANNSGFASQQIGDFAPALERLNEAAEEWQLTGERILAGRTLSNVALLYWYVNDFDRAIAANDQAARILRPRDPLAHAIVMNNLGLCFQSLAQYREAGRYFEQALKAENRLAPGGRDAIHARLNLGRNRMLQGDTAAAETLLLRAVAEATAASNRGALADALSNLSQNYLERKSAERARAAVTRSLELHKALADTRMEMGDLHTLGRAAAMLHEDAEARAVLNEAIQLGRRAALPDATSEALYSLARLEASAGRGSTARDLAERALELLEKVRASVPGPDLRASYYARKRKLFDLLLSIEVATDDASAAERSFLIAERGRARSLLDLLVQGPVVRPIPPDVRLRREQIRHEVGLLSRQLTTANSAAAEDALRARIEALGAERETLEARAEEAVRLPVATSIESFEDFRRTAIPDDCALIEYHLAEPKSYAWVVDRAGIRGYRLVSRSKIEGVARRVTDLFGRYADRRRDPRLEASFRAAVRRLSALLLGAMSGEVLPARVAIAPDGILNQVPFAALWLQPNGARLGLTHDLIQVPAASFLELGTHPPAASHFRYAFLGVADPVFGRAAGIDLPRLPYTADLDAVSSIVPASRRKLLRGFAASVASVKSLPLAEYQVLHFSTHAIVDDRIPELSRVALSMVNERGQEVDGFMHPADFAALRLSGSTIVLSACDTARGKEVIGEGLAGLTASLFQAGASQLVLSLSQVDAEGSAEFFRQTYSRYFAARPASMEHSLTLARRALAASGRWSDPSFWASFIVVGRPTLAERAHL